MNGPVPDVNKPYKTYHINHYNIQYMNGPYPMPAAMRAMREATPPAWDAMYIPKRRGVDVVFKTACPGSPPDASMSVLIGCFTGVNSILRGVNRLFVPVRVHPPMRR